MIEKRSKFIVGCSEKDYDKWFERRKQCLNLNGPPIFHPNPKSLTPYIDKRKWMFQTQTVPTVKSLTNKWGKDVAEILINQMTPIQRRLVGVDEIPEGPPEELWIDPLSNLSGKTEITVIPDQEYRKVFTHGGVVELCQGIEPKLNKYRAFMIQVTVKEAAEYERCKAREEWNKVFARNDDIHYNCMAKLHESLLKEHEMREFVVKEVYGVLREAVFRDMEKKHLDKRKKLIVEATLKIRKELLEFYKNKHSCHVQRSIEKESQKAEAQYQIFARERDKLMKEERRLAKKDFRRSLQYQNKLKFQNFERTLKFMETVCQATKVIPTMKPSTESMDSHRTVTEPVQLLKDKLKQFLILATTAICCSFGESEDLLIGIILKQLKGGRFDYLRPELELLQVSAYFRFRKLSNFGIGSIVHSIIVNSTRFSGINGRKKKYSIKEKILHYPRSNAKESSVGFRDRLKPNDFN